MVASYAVTAARDGCVGKSGLNMYSGMFAGVDSVGNITVIISSADSDCTCRSEELRLGCHICNGDCSTSLYDVVGRYLVNGCVVFCFPCEIASIGVIVCFNVVIGSGVTESA